MSELLLDPTTLYGELVAEFGNDVVWRHERASSSAVRSLTPKGVELTAGFFNDASPALSIPYRSPNVFALTTHPDNACHPRHRTIIRQYGEGSSTSAVLTEEDDYDYLEGFGDYPHIMRREILDQPELADSVRGYALGSYVMDVSTGDALKKITRIGNLEQIRNAGLKVIEAGDYVGRIDDEFLSRFSSTT